MLPDTSLVCEGVPSNREWSKALASRASRRQPRHCTESAWLLIVGVFAFSLRLFAPCVALIRLMDVKGGPDLDCAASVSGVSSGDPHRALGVDVGLTSSALHRHHRGED